MIGLAAYSNSFRVPFQYDDFHFLREQLTIKSFPLFFDWLAHNPAALIGGRAFLLFTFSLNYAINGLDTFGYHAVNLSIHISTAFLFYLLLRTYVDKGEDDHSHVLSILAATLFLIHPIASETVTYISSRSSGLSTFFVLASMLLFFRATVNRFHLIIYLVAICFFLLGLATKEVAIVTPVLLIAFDLYFISDREVKFRTRIKYHLPYWGLIAAGAFTYARYISQAEMFDRSWLTHLLTECKASVEYLGLMVYPSGLTIDHDIKESVKLDWPALRAITIISGLLAFAWYGKNKYKILSFSILWFFVSLAPFFVGRLNDYMADRWAYAASLGFALATSMALLAVRRRQHKTGMVVVLSLVLLWVTLTLIRNAVFQDPIALWTDAAKKAPAKTKAFTNLCGAYLERGNIPKAIEMCKTAVDKGCDDDETFINLSAAYFFNGDMAKAEAILREKAKSRARINPAYYYNLGMIYSRGGKHRLAILEYQKVLRMRPHYLAAYASIAECYLFLKDTKRAQEYYRMATKEIPQSGDDYLLLAVSYSQIGEPDKVAESFSKALITEPLNINVRQAVANVYFAKKMYDEAYRHYSIMAKIAPDLVIAYEGMGKAMLAKGDLKEARKQFTKAFSLLPPASAERKELMILLEKTGA